MPDEAKSTPKDTPPRASRVRAQTPPSSGSASQPRPRTRSGRGKFDQIEARLVEVINGIGGTQIGIGAMAGDARMQASGAVTTEFAERLASAWIDVARENERFAKWLEKLVQGSAQGTAIVISLAFVYTQAQVFGAIPANAPNPFSQVEIPVVTEPSPEVQREEARRAQQPPAPGDNGAQSARDAAEAARQEVEARRRRQGS